MVLSTIQLSWNSDIYSNEQKKKYVQSENIKRGLFGFLVTSLQDTMYVLLRMYRVFVWLFNIRSKISINFAFSMKFSNHALPSNK